MRRLTSRTGKLYWATEIAFPGPGLMGSVEASGTLGTSKEAVQIWKTSQQCFAHLCSIRKLFRDGKSHGCEVGVLAGFYEVIACLAAYELVMTKRLASLRQRQRSRLSTKVLATVVIHPDHTRATCTKQRPLFSSSSLST